MRIEINGRPRKRFDLIIPEGLTLSNNTVAYVAGRPNGPLFVVLGQVNGHEFDDEHEAWDTIGTSSPSISPNGLRVAYTACRGRVWYAAVDNNVIGGPYEGFSPGGILFSPDSNRSAYNK